MIVYELKRAIAEGVKTAHELGIWYKGYKNGLKDLATVIKGERLEEPQVNFKNSKDN